MIKFKGTLDVEFKGMKPFVDEHTEPMGMLVQVLGYAIRENGEKAVRDLVESIVGCHPDAVGVGLTRDAFIAQVLSSMESSLVILPTWLTKGEDTKSTDLAIAEGVYDDFVAAELYAQADRDELEDEARRQDELRQAVDDAGDKPLMIPVKEPITRSQSETVNITGTADIRMEDTGVEDKPSGPTSNN